MNELEEKDVSGVVVSKKQFKNVLKTLVEEQEGKIAKNNSSVRRSLPYLGIARRALNGESNYDIFNDPVAIAAMRVIRHTEPYRSKFSLILKREEILEDWCEAMGHKPSNVSFGECDCGMRRFDD